ncbi:MAG: hypothetical protein JXB46_06990 [Candidatus Eisenbacteria bacterium]|nr:hypothetical protein [Candidatus Eisenbacteria bacterium]
MKSTSSSRLRFAGVWLLFLSLALDAGGPTVQVSDAPGASVNPSVDVFPESGDIIVVWQDARPTAPGIYCRYYHADGSPATGEVFLAPGAEPDVAAAPDGNSRVAWLEGSPQFAIVDPNGRILHGPVTLAAGGLGRRPRIAVGPGNQTNVVHEYRRLVLYGVRVSRIDAAGDVLDPTTDILAEDLFGLEKWPDITFERSSDLQRLFVIFRDVVGINDFALKYGVVTANGLLDNVYHLSDYDEILSPATASAPAVLTDFWEESRAGVSQIVSGCNVLSGDPFSQSPGEARSVRCAAGTMKALAAWEDNRDGNWNIYYALQGSECLKAFPPGDVRVTYDSGNSQRPDIAGSDDRPVVVWQGDSTGDWEIYVHFADHRATCEIRNYPRIYGFSFENRPYSCSGDLFQETFGPEHTDFLPEGMPRAAMREFYRNHFCPNLAAGLCLGMCATSSLFHLNHLSVTDYNPNAVAAFDLAAEPPILRLIAKYHSYLNGVQIALHMVEEDLSRPAARDYYAAIESAVCGGTDLPILVIDGGAQSRHALLPYATRSNPSSGDLFVYDPNYPVDPLEPGDGKWLRSMSIDFTANTWSYPMDSTTTWSGSFLQDDPHPIFSLPTTLFTHRPIPVPEVLHYSDEGIIQLSVGGLAHLFVTDPQGHQLGFQGPDFVDTMPGGFRSLPIGTDAKKGESDPVKSYYLPEGDYTITITATDPETYEFELLASRTRFGATGELGEGASCEVRPDRTPDSFAVAPPAQGAGNLTLSLCKTSEESPPEWERSCSATFVPALLSGLYRISYDGDRAAFSLRNQSPASAVFTVSLDQTTSSARSSFGAESRIAIQAQETLTLIPEDWSFPSGSQITMQFDAGSDGTVDRTETYRLQAFRRGDSNADGVFDISDVICVLTYLFGSVGAPCKEVVPRCLDAADANDDGVLTIADPIRALGYLFGNGGPLDGPFSACGLDPTRDAQRCEEYEPCPAR